MTLKETECHIVNPKPLDQCNIRLDTETVSWTSEMILFQIFTLDLFIYHSYFLLIECDSKM